MYERKDLAREDGEPGVRVPGPDGIPDRPESGGEDGRRDHHGAVDAGGERSEDDRIVACQDA